MRNAILCCTDALTCTDVLTCMHDGMPSLHAQKPGGRQPSCGLLASNKCSSRVCVGQAGVERAAKLVGRLAYNRTIKDSVRDARGLNALLALLPMERGRQLDARLAETVMVALTILAVNNELNQDAIRSGPRAASGRMLRWLLPLVGQTSRQRWQPTVAGHAVHANCMLVAILPSDLCCKWKEQLAYRACGDGAIEPS